MKALILAGGFGTRLRPITFNIPKCLLKVNNKTILEHQLDLLSSFDDIILATNYLEDKIWDFLRKRNIDHVSINNEPEPLGTGGAIRNAEELLGKEFLVMNGDLITNCNIDKIIAKGTNTILLHEVDDVSRFGKAIFDNNGLITDFKEKEDVHIPGWINAGLCYLNNDIFKYIPKDKFVSLEREVFPILVREKNLKMVKNDGYWYDVGTKDDFIKTNLALANSDKVIGINCNIKNSMLFNSVIMDGCTIEDSTIKDSIIGPNNKISNMKINNEIIS